jgi:hypothetical protein
VPLRFRLSRAPRFLFGSCHGASKHAEGLGANGSSGESKNRELASRCVVSISGESRIAHVFFSDFCDVLQEFCATCETQVGLLELISDFIEGQQVVGRKERRRACKFGGHSRAIEEFRGDLPIPRQAVWNTGSLSQAWPQRYQANYRFGEKFAVMRFNETSARFEGH